MNIETLQPPEFSEDEQTQIITDLLALKKTQISDFLGGNGLPRSGTKEEIRGRIEESLANGSLAFSQLVLFLDEVIPWGKQHVFLYKGPSSSTANWKSTDWVAELLKTHRLSKFLNATLPLALPDKMKLSSILHDSGRLRVTAVKRRDWWERKSEYDNSTQTADGDAIELRAFVHRVTRSLVAFEWNLNSNIAFLQVSQLPTGFRYSEVAEEFFKLTTGWLDIKTFSVVKVASAIKNLHEQEETGTLETRSHGINYRTLQGRRFEGKSASPSDSLLGEPSIDAAMGAVRRSGVGYLGNFYWLPKSRTNGAVNPLDAEAHAIIVASDNRVNFPTANSEQAIRHVLSRIRFHSK